MRITNIQKKELSDIFHDAGLNILDFEITEKKIDQINIKYKHDYFYVWIRKIKDDLYNLLILSVSSNRGMGYDEPWESLVNYYKKWIQEIAEEISTKPGWHSIQSDNFLNAEFEELNQYFSKDEKKIIEVSIRELKDNITSLNLPQNSLTIIEEKLEDLSKKLDSLKKFDWKSLFIGTIANLIMTLSIPPDVGGIIWEYIKNIFARLRITG